MSCLEECDQEVVTDGSVHGGIVRWCGHQGWSVMDLK